MTISLTDLLDIELHVRPNDNAYDSVFEIRLRNYSSLATSFVFCLQRLYVVVVRWIFVVYGRIASHRSISKYVRLKSAIDSISHETRRVASRHE